MSEEFKQGEQIEVRNDIMSEWKRHNFVCFHKGFAYCETHIESGFQMLTPFKYCRHFNETILVPWESLSEVPIDAWFRYKGMNHASRILRINLATKELMFVNEWHRPCELCDKLEYSFDPINGEWKQCGKENV